ncbi:MAG: tRNA (adenosine(37)-N6)-dimethylallyltransferase MiaA [Patescibacteria group bacterium]|nr:tRNA (adenosine(37)-N6)-dimethylallyltransferase MiaA [Patescibacteria group bacterium]
MKSKILVILGPTATGKTDLALKLAKKYDGELVAADSRQIYRGLDIGSGKLPGKKVSVQKGDGFWVLDGIRVWLYDIADQQVRFNVADYAIKARVVLDDIVKRGKLPIVVGGSGLYIRALIEGIPNLDIPIDENLRRDLQLLNLEQLQKKLRELSPAKWKILNNSERNNSRRLLRSIELIMMYPYTNKVQKSKIKNQSYHTLKIGLTAPRSVLDQRINLRLVFRLKHGLIEEGKKLYQEGLSLERMKELGLEYGSLADLLSGKINERELEEQLQTKIHQYAKRQLTWFKKEKGVKWFDITDPYTLEKVEKLVNSWYDAVDDQKRRI